VLVLKKKLNNARFKNSFKKMLKIKKHIHQAPAKISNTQPQSGFARKLWARLVNALI